MIAILTVLFGTAIVALVFQRVRGPVLGSIIALGPAIATAIALLNLAPAAMSGSAVTEVWPWVPTLGVELAFRVDGLSLLFILLATGLGALVCVYAGAYQQNDPRRGRFFASLMVFAGAMVGLVGADDVITLFVFWELTSISSFFLIAHSHRKEAARSAAGTALLVTGAGGLALLAGLLLLGSVAGTYRLSEIAASVDVRADTLYLPILFLVCAGAFTKSAQAPFHFWLPGAMAAPTPVSAYLHSATMVKAGVYLLARLDPILGGTDAWTLLLSGVGGTTMILAAVTAIRRTDLKQVLAYSTVAVLGMLVLLLGLSFEASIGAALVLVVVHALYKGALFLVVGVVDHATGTRDVRKLSGLRRRLPITAVVAAVAGLSMAGLPPLFGFVGKELAYKAKLGFDGGELWLPALAVGANALGVAAASLVAFRPFFGAPEPSISVRQPSKLLIVPPLLLALGGLLFGALPSASGPLLEPAASAVLGDAVQLKLAPFYGFGPAFYLSVLTVVLGLAAAWAAPRFREAMPSLDALVEAPKQLWNRGLSQLIGRGGGLVDGWSRASVSSHIAWCLVSLLVLVGVALWPALGSLDASAAQPLRLHELLIGVLAVAGALVAAAVRSRLLAIFAIGIVGLAAALYFVTFSAPDLALTQVLVETLVVVAVAFAFLRLPAKAPLRSTSRIRSALRIGIAVGVGSVMALLTYAVATNPGPRDVSAWLAEHAVSEAHGRNIVNVILVDYRALDTLGEITVLAAAALGVAALVAGARRDRREAT